MEAKELPETTTEERLPWHKPEIQRLMVTIDTGFGPGLSVIDFAGDE